MSTSNPPKALLFDVFGTVVDWRKTVTTTLLTSATNTLNKPSTSLPSTVRLRASQMGESEWGELAQLWRNSYMHFVSNHDPSTPFISVDEHHHSALIKLLDDWQLTGLWTELEIVQLTSVWHYLEGWPDSSDGLAQLNKKFQTCTLSNGNTSLLSDMAEFSKLPWTHIFSGEDFKAYKPSPLVYNGAAKKLGLDTKECAMVAAHLGDLKAARGCGYQTVYVERAQEERYTPDQIKEAKEEGWVDMWVNLGEGKGGFLEVAKRFGIE